MSVDTPARRVLFVASELPPGPGGIGSQAHALAVELERQGRDVRLLGCQHYVEASARDLFNLSSRVPITTFVDAGDPARTAVSRFRQICDLIRSFEPDVVVGSGGRVLWITALACRRYGVSLLAIAHGSELGGSKWERFLTRKALDRADLVVAVSRFTAVRARASGVRAEIEVIHNGADERRFGPDAEAASSFRERHGLVGRKIVLTVGNVTERKGQHLVVEALAILARDMPEVTYVVVGRPTEANELRGLAERLGVSDHLLILGQLDADEVVDAMRAADVFAMTSTNTASGDVEGYGIAVVEAALCGVPGVVSSGTGAAEAVIDGRTGLIADPSSESVAEALAGLLSDAERRREMGDAARRAALDGGTWHERARTYGNHIDSLSSGTRAPRIVVVSHTEHYRSADGAIVAFGPTTRELDRLATLASELVHVAPLYEGEPPGSSLAAAAENIRFVPVAPAGGPRRLDRLLALRAIPRWALTIDKEMRSADVAHVRCPAGISIVALAVLFVRRHPRDRWVKYAGNWAPETRESFTYSLQRWWLRKGLARAAVTVNGRWPDQPRWVRTFDNPTLSDAEIEAGRRSYENRAAGPPWRAVFVGRVEEAKGVGTALETVARLRSAGVDMTLDVVGDGPMRAALEQGAPEGSCTFHGWVTRSELEGILAASHLLLLPTRSSEGFPKVVAEAMAFGCVPITTSVSSLGQVLSETGGAVVVDGQADWAEVVQSLFDRNQISELAEQGLAAVDRFSYDTYLSRVRSLAAEAWGRSL